YYSLTIKPGQMMKASWEAKCLEKARASWHNTGLALSDNDRGNLTENVEMNDCYAQNWVKSEITWMPAAGSLSNNYYLMLGCGEIGDGIEVRNFSISLTDYFDAGSQVDTANSFDNPIFLVEPGTYTGYLGGEDEADYYKFNVDDETTLTAKVTPPSDAGLSVAVYDKDKARINKEYPKNAGAIVTNTVPIKDGGDVYIAVEASSIPEGEIAKYDLEISTKAGVEESLKEKYSADWAEEMEKAEKSLEDLEKEWGGEDGLGETAKEAGKWIKRGFMGVLFYTIIPFIIGLIVLVGIIVVIIVILKRKKKK
ncbi:MAG: hypothetical protein ACOC6D_08495, partial [Atribacterota bacterium]